MKRIKKQKWGIRCNHTKPRGKLLHGNSKISENERNEYLKLCCNIYLHQEMPELQRSTRKKICSPGCRGLRKSDWLRIEDFFCSSNLSANMWHPPNYNNNSSLYVLGPTTWEKMGTVNYWSPPHLKWFTGFPCKISKISRKMATVEQLSDPYFTGNWFKRIKLLIMCRLRL